MCVTNMLPIGPYYILVINNPLKAGTIVITVLQDGGWGWLGVGVIQGHPLSPHYWAASHSDLSPSESLPLASLSASLNDSRCRVDPSEQPQDLGGPWEGGGRPIRTTFSFHPTETGFGSSTVTSHYVLLRELVPSSCLQIWNLTFHREDLLRMEVS